MWNSNWEKPDPLRGKRGWAIPDYVNIGIVVGLVVIAFGLFPPAISRVRDTDARVRWINELREREMTQSLTDDGP